MLGRNSNKHILGRNSNKQTNKIYQCTMANTSAIWQQAAHTNYHLLAAQQEPYESLTP